MTAKEIIRLLNLEPLSGEGGYYAETYKSEDRINAFCLPERFNEKRAFSTCIYYMLTPESFSAIHRLPTDEIWHFYLGDPIEQLQLFSDGSVKIVKLGNNLLHSQIPQCVVPKYVWQGARLIQGGKFALLGTTMAPGFEFADYEAGDKNKLCLEFPSVKKLIMELTD